MVHINIMKIIIIITITKYLILINYKQPDKKNHFRNIPFSENPALCETLVPGEFRFSKNSDSRGNSFREKS